jgi:hypothetical protein
MVQQGIQVHLRLPVTSAQRSLVQGLLLLHQEMQQSVMIVLRHRVLIQSQGLWVIQKQQQLKKCHTVQTQYLLQWAPHVPLSQAIKAGSPVLALPTTKMITTVERHLQQQQEQQQPSQVAV